MKNILLLSLISIFVFSTIILHGQEKCKVLKPNLSGTYKGKCKNGLANGKGIAIGKDKYEGQFSKGLPQGEGTYTWSNGSTYTGEWAAGMRHGIGKYTSSVNEKDSVLNGVWQEDKYVGPIPRKPYVNYNSGVDRYNFQKNNTTESRVLINMYQSGTRNLGISNFMMSTTSGSDTKIWQSVGYDFVVFPVSIKIMYTSWNKIHTIQYNVKFDFEIFEPGDWTVELHN